MSTVAVERYEYRCTKCFHCLYAATDEAGSERPCKYCGHQLVLPEATPERIARAENAPPEAPVEGGVPLLFRDEQMTDAQMLQEVKRQMFVPPGQMRDPSTIAAPRIKRLFGSLIDGILAGVAFGIGMALLVALMSAGFIDEAAIESKEFTLESFNALLAAYLPIVALFLFQWNLISVRGQSIGKMLLGMRIITVGGHNPGFLQGVVLRNWVRAALNLLPFFGLLDTLFIFGDAKRCLHDYIAGTYVVDTY